MTENNEKPIITNKTRVIYVKKSVSKKTPLVIQEKEEISNKTLRNKKTLSKKKKSEIWKLFENDKTVKQIEKTEQEEKIESGLCLSCKSPLVITQDGFPTCRDENCGKIYTNILDSSAEWRYYGSDDKNTSDPTRCGNPINPLLVESSFGCKVLCSSNSSYEMRKIRKWTEWQSMPHKEKSLYEEFQFITSMAQNAGIPKIFTDYAMVIHKDISEQQMFRGMNRDGIKAASLYISCRMNGCPRTAHEIAEIFKLDKTSATNGCSMAVNILQNIERNYQQSEQTELISTKPSAFIERFCSRLNMNGELTMLSKFIAKKVEENDIIEDNAPPSIAAGIVYFICYNCNMNVSKQDIKQVCNVSEPTINKCFKKLENIKDKLIPSYILEKYV
jgi:transcription initiation factor TFIIB